MHIFQETNRAEQNVFMFEHVFVLSNNEIDRQQFYALKNCMLSKMKMTWKSILWRMNFSSAVSLMMMNNPSRLNTVQTDSFNNYITAVNQHECIRCNLNTFYILKTTTFNGKNWQLFSNMLLYKGNCVRT